MPYIIKKKLPLSRQSRKTGRAGAYGGERHSRHRLSRPPKVVKAAKGRRSLPMAALPAQWPPPNALCPPTRSRAQSGLAGGFDSLVRLFFFDDRRPDGRHSSDFGRPFARHGENAPLCSATFFLSTPLLASCLGQKSYSKEKTLKPCGQGASKVHFLYWGSTDVYHLRISAKMI